MMALPVKKTSNVIGALLVVLIITSCSSNLERFGNLETRIKEYYTYEKNNEWGKTYNLRTPAFRRTVPVELYVSQMKKDNSGWRLDDFEILGAKEKEGKVYVAIKFSETAPISIVPSEHRTDVAPRETSTIRTERTENSAWMRVDNEWFCYDAVSRSRLSMNEPLVSE